MSELERAWMLHKAMGKKQEIEVDFFLQAKEIYWIFLFVIKLSCLKSMILPTRGRQKINICLIFELKQEDQVNGNSTCWHLKRKDTQGPALWRAGEARAVSTLCPSRTHWTFLPYPSQLWSSRPCRKPGVCHARSMCLCSSSVSMSIHVSSLKSRLRYGLLIWNYNMDVLSPYFIYRLVIV